MAKNSGKNTDKRSMKMSMTELAEKGRSDVLGSYTGTPLTDDDQPVQDADDL